MEVIDERQRCSHNVKVVITRMYFDNLLSKMRFVSHEPKLCN